MGQFAVNRRKSLKFKVEITSGILFKEYLQYLQGKKRSVSVTLSSMCSFNLMMSIGDWR